MCIPTTRWCSSVTLCSCCRSQKCRIKNEKKKERKRLTLLCVREKSVARDEYIYEYGEFFYSKSDRAYTRIRFCRKSIFASSSLVFILRMRTA